MARIDLTGQIFGNLTVMEPAPNKGRRSTWKCSCICGNIKDMLTEHLRRGAVTSCGCKQFDYFKQTQIKENLLNQRFGRLVVVAETEKNDNRHAWLCQCDCGKTKIIKAEYLKCGNTKSCGCLILQTAMQRIPELIKNNTKFTPRIASARGVWRRRYSDMIFEDFYVMSQQNCYYCGQEPILNMNKKDNYQIKHNYSEQEREFRYNGVDRLNSDLGHIPGNCVPCCATCNTSKRTLSVEAFLEHLLKIKIDNQSPSQYRQNYQNIDASQLIKSLKVLVKRRFDSIYTDGDLSLADFYKLSQLNCYYCNSTYSNKCYGYKGVEYIYNGLDRVDNTRGHYFDNVVPCCKHCNFMKLDMSLEDFYLWVQKVINYRKLR